MHNLNDFFSGVRWLLVENTSGEEIPAFGIMRVTGQSLTTGLITVAKPNANGQAGCLLNGPTAIPAPAGGVNATGQGTDDIPWFALYDVADGTPATGETWGPGNASWKLRKNFPGYLIYGGVELGRVLVGRPGGMACTPIITAIDFDLCTYTVKYLRGNFTVNDTAC